VLQQMLLAEHRRRHPIVAVEHLAKRPQIQRSQKETSDNEFRQINDEPGMGEEQYSEDGEGRGGVAGDAEAVGLDKKVVLPALGEAGVAVAQGRALGASSAELAPDQRGQGQRRRQPAPLPLCAGHRYRHRLFPHSRARTYHRLECTILCRKSSGTATMARRARIRIWGWTAS
jgi:hypothetical protein